VGFASSGASAAYLTVSEIFPVEVRAKAIAVFFAIAQTFGSVGPWLYGMLIGNGHDHFRLFTGYLIGAGVMIVGGVVEIALGVPAEQRSLEDIASPLSSVKTRSSRTHNSIISPSAAGRKPLTWGFPGALASSQPTLRDEPRRNSVGVQAGL
jgi:MFS family permease